MQSKRTQSEILKSMDGASKQFLHLHQRCLLELETSLEMTMHKMKKLPIHSHWSLRKSLGVIQYPATLRNWRKK